MQDSYWIAFLGIIMVSLKTNSPYPEPIKTPNPGVLVIKKTILILIFQCIPYEVLFLKKLE